MDLGPHASFIVIAYLVAMLVVVVLIGWIVVDRRTLIRNLDDLERRGVTRRSDRASGKTT
jgi:heme exporter protein D